MTDRIKQFSYDPLKSIVKFSDLEKREQFSKCIFSLKKIDAVVPYHFDDITVGSEFMEIQTGKLTRLWHFQPVNPEEPDAFHFEEDQDIKKFTHCNIILQQYDESQSFERKQSYEVMLGKLLKEYLRKGTKVDSLGIFALPTTLAELGNVRLKVKRLHFDMFITQNILHPWLALISDEGPFEAVKIEMYPMTIFMFSEPRIQSCTRLKLRFPFLDTIPLEGWFVNLQNRHIDVIHLQFPMEIIKVMIRKWVNWRRPLGTSFTLGIQYYTTVLDAFEMAQAELNGKPSNFPEITNSFCTHCCTIPVDDQLEVVIFGGRRANKYAPFDWDLKVKVMKKGRTVPKQ